MTIQEAIKRLEQIARQGHDILIDYEISDETWTCDISNQIFEMADLDLVIIAAAEQWKPV